MRIYNNANGGRHENKRRGATGAVALARLYRSKWRRIRAVTGRAVTAAGTKTGETVGAGYRRRWLENRRQLSTRRRRAGVDGTRRRKRPRARLAWREWLA